jgi:hypothetical protein
MARSELAPPDRQPLLVNRVIVPLDWKRALAPMTYA